MLSNKLTFSLSFIVMLICGLVLMATPVEAQAPQYSAEFDADAGTGQAGEWIIKFYLPVTADDVESVGGGVELIGDPPIAADPADLDDGIAGLAFTNILTPPGVSSPVFQTAPGVSTPAVDRESRAKFAEYTITVTRDGTKNVSFTYEDYDTVVLKPEVDDATPPMELDTTTIELTVLTSVGINSYAFTIDPSVSSFAIIYNEDSDDPDRDQEDNIIPGTGKRETHLGNGIRIGEGYVPEAATHAMPGQDWVDLAAFFAQGGTIKVVGDNNDPVVTEGVFITEIMWGYDAEDGIGAPSADDQWIEVYYTANEEAATTPAAIDLRLVFVYSALDEGGIDHVSNLYLAKWAPKGQSGRTQYSAIDGSPPIPVVSMYRKREIIVGGVASSTYDPDAKFAANGKYPVSWEVSRASVNMQGFFTGTPGAAHLVPTVGGGFADYAKNEIPGSPLQFSEVRNDGSGDNVDWIEIRNVSEAPVNVKDYEISLVTDVGDASRLGKWDAQGRENRRWANLDADKKAPLEHELAIVGVDTYYDQVNNDVKAFPDWMLPAGAYLLIVNKDPKDTILAGGKDIEILANAAIDNKTTNKGSGVYYFVTPHLRFTNKDATPADGPLLVMRSRKDRNEYEGKVHGDKSASIIDLAGGGRFKDTSAVFNTEVYPLRGWKDPGGSPNISGAGVWNFVKDKDHEWWKTDGVANNRVGYDKNTPARLAVGSPGYPNGVVKDKLTDHKGTPATTDDVTLLMGNISISEIMFDASVHAGNERWNLVQWIELYNSSMTEAINLKGWEFEIRNSNDHVDSFVDSSFLFKDLSESIIHPNQTLLLVSARASSSGVADRQIYNLYVEHARELGLANRRANLLSPAGFFLRLSYKANDGSNTKIVADEAGNVAVNGRQRTTTEWAAIPPSEDPVRRSLVRQYGTRAEDGDGPDLPAVGTLEESWIEADLDGEGATYFGQRGDIATPGFRTGGPLPVSLASFRPVRNDAGTVIIKWITASELNNAGFNILRSQQRNGEFKVINPKMIAGAGTTSERNIYTFTDTTANPNVVYYYQIEDVSFDGRHQTLTTQRLKGHVSAGGKLTTTWSDLKQNR